MKNSRILSLLLAAVMTATSLPLVTGISAATPEGKTPYNVNLLASDISTNASYWQEGELKPTPIDGAGTYLRIDDRPQGNADLYGLQLDVTSAPGGKLAAGTYKLVITARAQIDGVECTKGGLRARAKDWGFDTKSFDITASKKIYDNTQNITLKTDVTNLQILFQNGGAFNTLNPVEIYEIEVRDTSGNSLYKNTLVGEDLKEIKGWTHGDSSGGIGTTSAVDADIITETDFLRVSATDDYSAKMQHAPNIKLTPGKYELDFDARQSFFFTNTNHNQEEYAKEAAKGNYKGVREIDLDPTRDNTAGAIDYSDNKGNYVSDVNAYYHILFERKKNDSNAFADGLRCFHANYRDVAVKLNDGAIELYMDDAKKDAVRVTDDWNSYKMTFEVPAGKTYTLNSISFGGTGKAYDNDAFDINNISLKLVEVYDYDYSPADPDNILEDKTPAGGTIVNEVTEGYDKNGYITVGRLPWHWEKAESTEWQPNVWMISMKLNAVPVKDVAYGVSFRAREHVANNENTTVQAHIVGEWNTAITHQPLSNEWQQFSGNFKSTSNSGIVLFNIRKGSGGTEAPVDIDNLVIWMDNDNDKVFDAGETLLYSEDFNDPNKEYIGTANDENKLYSKLVNALNRVGTHRLYHNFDDEYASVTANDGVASYTGLDVDEGAYTFTADVRAQYHYNIDLRSTCKDNTQETVNKIETAYAYNSHKATVAFTLTPEDGGAVILKEVEVPFEPTWSKINANVIIEDGYKLTKIEVIPTFGFPSTATDAIKGLDIKNADLRFVSPVNNKVNADAENFLDKATENYGSSLYTTTEASEDGYISIGRRLWFWDGDDKGYAANIKLLDLQLDHIIEAGWTYKVKLDARPSVDTNGKQLIWVKIDGQNCAKYTLENTTEWQRGFEFQTTSAKAGNKLSIYIRRNDDNIAVSDVPVDIDNLVIWREKDGTSEEIYNKNFNNSDETYIGSGTGLITVSEWGSAPAATQSLTFTKKYATLTPEIPENTPVLSYNALNDGAGHGEGVYTFKADLRVPYFFFKRISLGVDDSLEIAQNDTAALDAFYAFNTHPVDVVFTMTPIAGGDDITTTLKGEIDYNWSTLETTVVVNEGYKLTKIEIKPSISDKVPAGYRKLDFKNVILGHADLPVISDEGTDNYLDELKPQYENTAPAEIIVDDPNGYVYIGERAADHQYTLFSINTGTAVTKDKEYIIEFDFTAYAGAENTAAIRPKLNIATNYSNNCLDGAEGNQMTVGYNKPDTQFQTSKIGETVKFRAKFIAGANTSNLIINVNRGNGGTAPFAIDNIKIYEKESLNEICVNNFDEDTSFDVISVPSTTTCGVEHILPVSHTLYTPYDSTQPMKITYNLGLTPDEAVEGKYSFKTMVKLYEATDKAAKARVIFNYSDGTSDINYIDLTEDWSYIGKSDWLERYPDLVSITIEFDSDVPVMLISPELNIVYKYRYGKPNTGIVMILIKKMQGGFTDPWKQIDLDG